jgi:hypothetical protein
MNMPPPLAEPAGHRKGKTTGDGPGNIQTEINFFTDD